MQPPRILFVCLGNICRSPAAEGIALALDHDGLAQWDSAGTGSWHVGDPPHPPMVAAAAHRGYDLSPLRARQVRPTDFRDFDLILAMDAQNLADLRMLSRAAPQASAETAMLLDYCGGGEVPDPYYGGPAAFEECLDAVERGVRALLASLGRGALLPF